MNQYQQRTACDRCHRQKIRCIRSVTPDGPCSRCMQAGQKCTASPALPPGRPISRMKSITRAQQERSGQSNRTMDAEILIGSTNTHETPTMSMGEIPDLCSTEHLHMLTENCTFRGNGKLPLINRTVADWVTDRLV